jgi:hypothetical protein
MVGHAGLDKVSVEDLVSVDRCQAHGAASNAVKRRGYPYFAGALVEREPTVNLAIPRSPQDRLVVSVD